MDGSRVSLPPRTTSPVSAKTLAKIQATAKSKSTAIKHPSTTTQVATVDKKSAKANIPPVVDAMTASKTTPFGQRTMKMGKVFHSNSTSSSVLENSARLAPVCSLSDMKKVRDIFGGRPWEIRQATKCPVATWLDDYFYHDYFVPFQATIKLSQQRNKHQTRPLVGVFLGCNKGDDAVRTWRKFSADNVTMEQYNKALTMAIQSPELGGHESYKLDGRACRKHDNNLRDLNEHPLWSNQPLWTRSGPPTPKEFHPAKIVCVEALPSQARFLQGAVDRLKSDSQQGNNRRASGETTSVPQIHIVHGAMGGTDGFVAFPGQTQMAGMEIYGAHHCYPRKGELNGLRRVIEGRKRFEKVSPAKKAKRESEGQWLDTRHNQIVQKQAARQKLKCVNVTQYTLDRLVRMHVFSTDLENSKEDTSNMIFDFLSVDVEGNDWAVLGSPDASWTLPRVRYLEFERHKIGLWTKANLSDAIEGLREHGFVCYFAGQKKLWRLTDCFQHDLMDARELANVACVNVHLNPALAKRMESIYHNELARDLDKERKQNETNKAQTEQSGKKSREKKMGR